MILATVPSWSEEHHKMYDQETMLCGDCRHGSKQSSLVDCYTDLHAEWSSHYVVGMLGRIRMHQENIRTVYMSQSICS